MKADPREWVRYAEEDFPVATTLFRGRSRNTPANAICFHCQQCVEKYLKARLTEARLAVPKVHDLVLLLQSVLHLESLWSVFADVLRSPTAYAVKFRYPGHPATRADARSALKSCRVIRAEIRLSLRLSKK